VIFITNGIPYSHLDTSFFGFLKTYQNKNVSLEKFHGYQLICKNHETFSPQMNCIIQYGMNSWYKSLQEYGIE